VQGCWTVSSRRRKSSIYRWVAGGCKGRVGREGATDQSRDGGGEAEGDENVGIGAGRDGANEAGMTPTPLFFSGM
jgi:hypothetical protein